MTHVIADRTTISQGMPITVTTVDGLDRIEINNRLHHLGDQILKLKMQQDELMQMRHMIDSENDRREANDLFDELFGG